MKVWINECIELCMNKFFKIKFGHSVGKVSRTPTKNNKNIEKICLSICVVREANNH